MRWLPALLFAACAGAQQAPFTLDQVLGAAFPSELTAAPAGGKLAWIANVRGVRNVMVAEPPRYQARKLTDYSRDDGQEIRQLAWMPGASAVLYVRGGSANPALNPAGPSSGIWIAPLDGSAARRLGDGSAPAASPKGDRVAFLNGGQIWFALADGSQPASPAFRARGTCTGFVWSPDGARIAFVSDRGDHSFIGVYDVAASALRYLDASTAHDSYPEWAPDGRTVAFVRTPSTGLRQPREARREAEPWSIRVAPAETGAGRELWRAREGTGSVFREMTAPGQLLWTASGRIVFPWEGDGWLHLYSIPAAGGAAALLTPGAFEVDCVTATPGRREIIFSSNQADLDRRHLWKVDPASGPPAAITRGAEIETAPAVTSDGAIAWLRSGAQRPLSPVLRVNGEVRDLDPAAIPGDFPIDRMVRPEPVLFPSADGLQLHGQLFLPPGRREGKAPAVVFFHGGPRRQMLLGWHPMEYYWRAYAFNQYLANAGYAVLSVNFRSGVGYGMEFREALQYGPSGASDYNDVRGAALYLRSRADIDPAHIGAWGGSYGGFLTAMALARASDLYAAGVDFHGVHDWAVELNLPPTAPDYNLAYDSSPMAFVKDWRSPVLLIHGDDDPDVLFNNTVMLASALRRRKVEVETLVLPEEVHDFLLHSSWLKAYEASFGFLDRHLRPQKP